MFMLALLAINEIGHEKFVSSLFGKCWDYGLFH